MALKITQRERKRKRPSAAEQARRVAWGKQWGAANATHAKTYTKQGG